MTKKPLCILTAAACLFTSIGMFGSTVSAEDATTAVTAEQTVYSGSCGENITWTYDIATQTMTFSGTGDFTTQGIYNGTGAAVWMNGSVMDADLYQPTTVIFEEGLTSYFVESSLYGILKNDWPHVSVYLPQSATSDKGYNGKTFSIYSEPHLTVYGWDGTWMDYKYGPLPSEDDPEAATSFYVSRGMSDNPTMPYTGTDENGISWDFDGETRTLTLSGSGQLRGDSKTIALFPEDCDIVLDETFQNQAITKLEDANQFLALGEKHRIFIHCNSPMDEWYDTFCDYMTGLYAKYKSDITVGVGFGNVRFLDMIGDVNQDGCIDLEDAVLLSQKIQTNEIQEGDELYTFANCYTDSVVDSKDVVTLLQFLVDIVPSLPVAPEA